MILVMEDRLCVLAQARLNVVFVLLFSVVGGHPAVPPVPLYPAAESCLTTGLFDW